MAYVSILDSKLGECVFVGLIGFEPKAFRLSDECSLRLSYKPIVLLSQLIILASGARMGSAPTSQRMFCTM